MAHAALLIGRFSADIMSQIALEILAAYDRDGRTFVFGNGGSAATASHMACDLSKNIVTDGIPHLRCVSLTDNTPLLTALANDRGGQDNATVLAARMEP